jgi:cell division septum initiation protein DivIVA
MPSTQRLLELALMGLEAERARLDDEINQIKNQLNHNGKIIKTSGNGMHSTSTTSPKKRTMSAEARKRISEGMKRRYAELRKAVKSAKK